MEKGCLSGRMDGGTKESTKIIKSKEKECFIDRRGKVMTGIGLMDCNMEKELCIIRAIEVSDAYGKTEKRLISNR
jgi:hypothetical protein